MMFSVLNMLLMALMRYTKQFSDHAMLLAISLLIEDAATMSTAPLCPMPWMFLFDHHQKPE